MDLLGEVLGGFSQGIPVRLTCGVLGHSTQAYYVWLRQPVRQRDQEDASPTSALVDAYDDDPEFGFRLLADEFERAGHVVGERRIGRLCSQQRLWSCTVRKGRRGSGKTPGTGRTQRLGRRWPSAQVRRHAPRAPAR